MEFNTSKLGIRVRGGTDKKGLFVACVTAEAPNGAKEKIPDGAQIISVNKHNLENESFDKAVEHFAQLTLPITVVFRPPLHPPVKEHRDHHHDHDHHHHCNDDEDDGTCYVACYMIMFVISFMLIVSVSLNGFSFPTSMPSMPRMFPERKRGKRRNKREMLEESSESLGGGSAGIDKFSDMKDPADVDNRRLLHDAVGDMNNIQNIWDNMEMNLDQDIEEKDLFKGKEQ